ncbi:MAG: hypothetical protein OIF57_06525 [Marinobacterium sp.]|nr:hypothetical protein [Marinobacterium sp.]
MKRYTFELFADYFQIYLMDTETRDDTSEIWTDKALDLKLGLLPNTLAIGTFRNVDVPVEVDVYEQPPEIDLQQWDHASQGYFTITSGRCAVFGCTDYFPDAAFIELPPGKYTALSLARGLTSITEEWDDADDLYKVILWPSSVTDGSVNGYPENDYKALKYYGDI